MKTFTQTLLVVATLVIGHLSASAQMNLQYADTLSKVLEQCQEDENMKGIAGAVVFSDGSVWSAAAGNHGNATLTTDYLYDIGSNTKTMVATLLLLLEEEGLLSLDDTLYQYISPIANVPNGIALKQLLGHRSGVFSFTEHPGFANEINTNDTKFWSPDSILANFINAPHFSPGNGWRYSNTGYILLGKVIEVVENKPLHQVLRERLFDPMELDNMFLDQYDNYAQTKTGAWLSNGSYFDDDFVSFMSAAWSAGAVVSTPEDLARYAHTLYRGEVLNDSSMDKMRTGTTLTGGVIGGLGLFESTYKGKTYLGHGGTTLQNSEMEYSLESDFSLVLMNIDQGYYDETARAKYKMLDLIEYIEQNHVEDTAATAITETATKKMEVSAFPNPSNMQMTLQVNDATASGVTHVELLDMTGRVVYRQAMMNGRVTLNKSDLGGGVYFANVYGNQGLLGSKRIIIH